MKIKIFNPESIDGDGYDVLVSPFADGETINYAKELKGDTTALKDLAAMTDYTDKSLVYAADTDNYGIIKRSAAVFENGKLLGISDATVAYSYDEHMPGANGKLYDLKSGKIGVSVDGDITAFELMRAFAICGAEAVIAVKKTKNKEIGGFLLRAYSYLLGIPFLLCAKDGVYAFDPQGNPITPDENGVYTLLPANEYALKTIKIRSTRK